MRAEASGCNRVWWRNVCAQPCKKDCLQWSLVLLFTYGLKTSGYNREVAADANYGIVSLKFEL